jgi:CubicO group peptidase (beta-lactamase class C family)
MNDAATPRVPPLPVLVEPLFDRTPVLGRPGPVAPLVHDASPRALRLRTVSFAAKRLADMVHVSGFAPEEAQRRLRWRAATPPGGLDARPASGAAQAELDAAVAAGRLTVAHDLPARRVAVTWTDPGFGPPITGRAIAPPGWGGIVLGAEEKPRFDPRPIARAPASASWDEQSAHAATVLQHAADTFLAAAPGATALLIAAPGKILFERYANGGAPDRATPSWSMTKTVTATLIGRLLHEGWLRSVHDAARAPLWGDPRGAHAAITIDHLLRMRAGLAMPVLHEDGSTTLGFENSAVYQDGADAFATAQRSIVATRPGAVFRYVNAGPNVLGAVIRAEIERRGLPYPETVYQLLADRIGMGSYQHSADIAGNLIASGSGFATARDYAKLGLLYAQDGVWEGERLLPEGWVDYACAATHGGTTYTASFRCNADGLFPDLPPDTVWAVGASDQRIFVFRRHGLVAVVTNETDHPIDLGRLNYFLATALAVF